MRITAANTGLAKVAVQCPQTHLWLIKVSYSASAFVVKITTFAKPETVIGYVKTIPNDA
ncbi:hypothetical protein [Flavobacterium sp.]|uniref:hypothetical protein n=1 Tax=Flavobacterium sp. TaxID=239 RepID=UPI002605E5D5|nr:hypothetical protein [Flavobacterium sp.]